MLTLVLQLFISFFAFVPLLILKLMQIKDFQFQLKRLFGRQVIRIKVTPELNAKKEKYQEDLKNQRQKYIQQYANKPTRAQSQELLQKAKRNALDDQWKSYMNTLKQSYQNPNSPLRSTTFHPCRPNLNDLYKKRKNHQKGEERLNQSRKFINIMRQKYIQYMNDEIIPNLITENNIEQKIQYALDHPINYTNQTAEYIVEQEKRIKTKLKLIRV